MQKLMLDDRLESFVTKAVDYTVFITKVGDYGYKK
ncbi:hypothetical protein Y592_08685 [Thermosipho sp. 1070]|nr:hypothetical protein Y592_08685 [Thermosipho sp. 1070]